MMTNKSIITQLKRLLPELHYADDANAVKAVIKKLEQKPIKILVQKPKTYWLSLLLAKHLTTLQDARRKEKRMSDLISRAH